MKKSRIIAMATCLAIGPMLSGCSSRYFENIVGGLQDRATTTATEFINAFFDSRFPMAAAANGGGAGDDLFIRM